MLSTEDTLELLKKAKQGDEDAKNILINKNSPLVKSIVKRYKNKGVEYDDLYQLGCLGFAKAIKNFDENFNVKFSTYAVPMIAGEIKRFLRDDGSIKVSRTIKSQNYVIQKYIEQARTTFGQPPTVKEIAEKFHLDEEEVMFILESNHKPISIFEGIDHGEGSGQTLLDKFLPVEDDSNKIIDKMVLMDAISNLDKKDKTIIALRYFRDKTQSEVARLLNVSQVQVSRMENKILSKIKSKIS